jgi:hypothetical protein
MSPLNQAVMQPNPIKLGADLFITGDLTPFRLAARGFVFGGHISSSGIEVERKAGQVVW